MPRPTVVILLARRLAFWRESAAADEGSLFIFAACALAVLLYLKVGTTHIAADSALARERSTLPQTPVICSSCRGTADAMPRPRASYRFCPNNARGLTRIDPAGFKQRDARPFPRKDGVPAPGRKRMMGRLGDRFEVTGFTGQERRGLPQLANIHDLPRLDRIQLDQGSRDVCQQVFEAIGFGAENDDGNPSGLQILRLGYALIDRQQNIETGCFGRRGKVAIFESRQPGVTRRLAVVTGQKIPQPLVNAFVDQNAHSGP